MKKKKYYGVAGANACGVYDNYERVLEAKMYVAGFKCKKFDDYYDAKWWAENTYDDYQDGYYGERREIDICKLNWLHYRKA